MSKYLKKLTREPEFLESTQGIGIAKEIANAFLEGTDDVMTVTRPKEYRDDKALARALGAVLHGKNPSDKQKKMVRIVKDGNVYLRRK